MGIVIWSHIMKNPNKILPFLALIFFIGHVKAVSDSQRIAILEGRVASLEATLNNLETFLEARYELKRRPRTCQRPLVPNGGASCGGGDLKRGAQCTVWCNSGYIATPGKVITSCKKDGSWDGELQCEIPLVVVSGGNTNTRNRGQGAESGVEVLSLYPSKGCNASVPQLPLDGGAHRSAHSMIYVPPQTMLACNGMSNKNNLATCDTWTFGNTTTWKHHSYPNKGLEMMGELFCERDWPSDELDEFLDGMSMNDMCRKHPNKNKGRYAAAGFRIGHKNVIFGGMVYDKNGHDPVNTVRESEILDDKSWSVIDMGHGTGMERKRAFFCAVKIEDAGVLAIGGLGTSNTGNIVEKSVEFKKVGMNFHNLNSIAKFSDMSIPRSGHSCAPVHGDNFRVLVSGGTRGFGQPALAGAEIFNWNTNSWEIVAKMRTGRFGHAVVAVGDKIFAIGGDDRNQNNVFDTIEEYDVKKNSWSTVGQKLNIPRSNFGYTLVPHSIIDGCVITRPL